MKKAYTAKEIGQLLSMTERGVLEKAKREGWQAQPRKGRGGGNEWLVASMPEETRHAIQTAEIRRAAEQEKALMPVRHEALAYSHPDYNRMILDNKRRDKALAKSDLVTQYIVWQKRRGFTVEQKNAFVAAYLGGAWPGILAELGPLSWKSLENWKNLRSRGDVVALADKRGIAHKGKTALTEQHYPIILGQLLNPNKPNISQCVRQIQARCDAGGLWVPSEPTIRRFVNAYSSECFGEYTFWREGKKAWNDKCAVSILRDWSLVQVGDVVFADGHTLNFETLDPETGKAKRMTLLLFFDGASNYPLGWEIMAMENTACISSAFRRACLILGKFPLVVYLDNGKAFRAKFFSSCPDFGQAGILGLYDSLGCEVIHAWPYHGQSKTVERFFGTFHEMEVFTPSYTGNSIEAKPARMMRGERMHRQLYERMGGRPLTLEETHRAVALWFEEYARRPQPRTHLAGRTPGAVFEAGRGPGVDMSRLTLLMLQKEIKTISKDGIRHRGRLYWHEKLANRRHPVLVRYDDQLSPYEVLVYKQDGEFLCQARDRHHYKIAAGIHPAAGHLGTEEQKLDLVAAIELKKHQEKEAGANFRTMLNTTILPELQQRQAALEAPKEKISTFAPAPAPAPMSAEQIAAFEAAQEKALREYAEESDPKYYKPAHTLRFATELKKYDYIFKALHEKGATLVPQDEAWMRAFEESPEFSRGQRQRYEDMKEYYAQWRSA